MLRGFRQWYRLRFKAHVCPDCGLKCASPAGLGRHRAAERRAKAAQLPLPVVPEGSAGG